MGGALIVTVSAGALMVTVTAGGLMVTVTVSATATASFWAV